MSNHTLFINSTDFHKLQLSLIFKDKFELWEQEVAFNENYKTLEIIENFLKSHKTTLSDLTKIIVCSGPGSFTGIRVGVSLAEALAFGLKIPVITLPKSKIPKNLTKLAEISSTKKPSLTYGAKPNITKAKKKTRY